MSDIEVPIMAMEGAQVPSYAHEGDGAVDLRSSEELIIQPLQRALIPTGISMAIPQGFVGLVLPRSGLAIKQGLGLVNAPGLIDSNYRGEIKVIAINHDTQNPIAISAGDRIAQLLIIPVPHITFVPVENLDDTSRGVGGFGSSGIR